MKSKNPCLRKFGYSNHILCNDQLLYMVEKLNELYPYIGFNQRFKRVKEGQFKGCLRYQIKQGKSFIGKIFGRILIEFDESDRQTLKIYDDKLLDFSKNLPDVFHIENIEYIKL
ncbi:MAG: hypothetical protein KKF52_03000 [Nanoarchaeota archaeon]|nr:hypothetical protein [Nanoarchaeota archaeon]MBU4242176.1 hypothetical protein [Nanoarchaeota archaeon]MBU4352734.1 hypothetical protein [Nanoarchaeota archaeon]